MKQQVKEEPLSFGSLVETTKSELAPVLKQIDAKLSWMGKEDKENYGPYLEKMNQTYAKIEALGKKNFKDFFGKDGYLNPNSKGVQLLLQYVSEFRMDYCMLEVSLWNYDAAGGEASLQAPGSERWNKNEVMDIASRGMAAIDIEIKSLKLNKYLSVKSQKMLINGKEGPFVIDVDGFADIKKTLEKAKELAPKDLRRANKLLLEASKKYEILEPISEKYFKQAYLKEKMLVDKSVTTKDKFDYYWAPKIDWVMAGVPILFAAGGAVIGSLAGPEATVPGAAEGLSASKLVVSPWIAYRVMDSGYKLAKSGKLLSPEGAATAVVLTLSLTELKVFSFLKPGEAYLAGGLTVYMGFELSKAGYQAYKTKDLSPQELNDIALTALYLSYGAVGMARDISDIRNSIRTKILPATFREVRASGDYEEIFNSEKLTLNEKMISLIDELNALRKNKENVPADVYKLRLDKLRGMINELHVKSVIRTVPKKPEGSAVAGAGPEQSIAPNISMRDVKPVPSGYGFMREVPAIDRFSNAIRANNAVINRLETETKALKSGTLAPLRSPRSQAIAKNEKEIERLKGENAAYFKLFTSLSKQKKIRENEGQIGGIRKQNEKLETELKGINAGTEIGARGAQKVKRAIAENAGKIGKLEEENEELRKYVEIPGLGISAPKTVPSTTKNARKETGADEGATPIKEKREGQAAITDGHQLLAELERMRKDHPNSPETIKKIDDLEHLVKQELLTGEHGLIHFFSGGSLAFFRSMVSRNSSERIWEVCSNDMYSYGGMKEFYAKYGQGRKTFEEQARRGAVFLSRAVFDSDVGDGPLLVDNLLRDAGIKPETMKASERKAFHEEFIRVLMGGQSGKYKIRIEPANELVQFVFKISFDLGGKRALFFKNWDGTQEALGLKMIGAAGGTTYELTPHGHGPTKYVFMQQVPGESVKLIFSEKTILDADTGKRVMLTPQLRKELARQVGRQEALDLMLNIPDPHMNNYVASVRGGTVVVVRIDAENAGLGWQARDYSKVWQDAGWGAGDLQEFKKGFLEGVDDCMKQMGEVAKQIKSFKNGSFNYTRREIQFSQKGVIDNINKMRGIADKSGAEGLWNLMIFGTRDDRAILKREFEQNKGNPFWQELKAEFGRIEKQKETAQAGR